MTRSYVVLAEVRAPYEDTHAVQAVTRFVAESQPDEVIILGGLVDRAEATNDPRGTARHLAETVLLPLRDSFDGRLVVLPEEHRDLIPDGREITCVSDWYRLGSDWVLTHGHIDALKTSRIAGNTALNVARKLDRSVIMGRTRRLGKGSHSIGYDGEIISTLTGVEVGHLINIKNTHYRKMLSDEHGQQGLACVEQAGDQLSVTPTVIKRGQLTVNGSIYSAHQPQRVETAH